jgi:translation initiation factor 2B subunit (eIF-2B alpha/beta/delta family)
MGANASGTRLLFAPSFRESSGVPVFVLAGAEKLLPVAVYRSLPLVEREPDELDTALPEHARNPYLDRIPAELATQLITDRGAFPFDEAERSGWWTAAVLARYELIVLT